MKNITKILILLFFFGSSLASAPTLEIPAHVRLAPCKEFPYPTAYAPELFGLGRSEGLICDKQVTGYISNSWVSFRFVGALEGNQINGTLSQISGPIVWDRATPTGPDQLSPQIQYKMVLSRNGFVGWIYFRGHIRKLCGGYQTMPAICLYRGG